MKKYILLIFPTERTGKLREEILPSFLPCVQFFNITLVHLCCGFSVTVFHECVLKIYREQKAVNEYKCNQYIIVKNKGCNIQFHS